MLALIRRRLGALRYRRRWSALAAAAASRADRATALHERTKPESAMPARARTGFRHLLRLPRHSG
jgi:hypothetical protein